MTDVYQVRVLSVAGDQLTCRLTAFDDDFPPSRTLALQLLWEVWGYFSEGLFQHFVADGGVTPEQAEELGRTAAIGRELAGQDICDGDWTRANVDRFIRRVDVWDRVWRERGGDVEEEQLEATYIITVTDPRWLEHLRAGMAWGTTAYDKDEQD